MPDKGRIFFREGQTRPQPDGTLPASAAAVWGGRMPVAAAYGKTSPAAAAMGDDARDAARAPPFVALILARPGPTLVPPHHISLLATTTNSPALPLLDRCSTHSILPCLHPSVRSATPPPVRQSSHPVPPLSCRLSYYIPMRPVRRLSCPAPFTTLTGQQHTGIMVRTTNEIG